jgi:seryl-tRNA synthetase
MTLPSQPVTLTVEQLAELNRQLSTMRHDINNALTVTNGVAEMIRMQPQTALQRADVLLQQVRKIGAHMATFSAQFEAALGITRP